MGTRSLTYIYETYTNDNVVENIPIVCMYRQYDGYVEGHGAELAEFIVNGKIVNGIGIDEAEGVWNGMGCLAASMVAHFKKEAGQFYLHAPVLNRDDWQEYEYHVFGDKVIVYQIGSNNNNLIFEGDYQAFAKFCNVVKVSVDVTDKEQVKAVLHGGEVTVTFTKVDGTERVMRCTLNEDSIPGTSQVTSAGKRVVSDEVQPVFDLDAQHWKSFRWDSLLDVKVV